MSLCLQEDNGLGKLYEKWWRRKSDCYRDPERSRSPEIHPALQPFVSLLLTMVISRFTH